MSCMVRISSYPLKLKKIKMRTFFNNKPTRNGCSRGSWRSSIQFLASLFMKNLSNPLSNARWSAPLIAEDSATIGSQLWDCLAQAIIKLPFRSRATTATVALREETAVSTFKIKVSGGWSSLDSMASSIAKACSFKVKMCSAIQDSSAWIVLTMLIWWSLWTTWFLKFHMQSKVAANWTMVCNFKSLSSRGALVDFSGSHTNASSSWQEETPIQSEWIAHLEPNQIPQDIGQMKKKKRWSRDSSPPAQFESTQSDNWEKSYGRNTD